MCKSTAKQADGKGTVPTPKKPCNDFPLFGHGVGRDRPAVKHSANFARRKELEIESLRVTLRLHWAASGVRHNPLVRKQVIVRGAAWRNNAGEKYGLEVTWPNGRTRRLKNPAIDRYHVVRPATE
jgi:hypothetical protein